MDVQNGDILAIASAPSFDPNLFVRGISHADYNALTENDHRPLANKTVAGAYPPGSTFKMVTALAALEAGAITTSTTVYCPGHYEVGGRKFHCWRSSGHGKVSLDRALGESCDVFFYDIAMKVGIDKIAEMGRRLGLGERHDLPMSAITDGLMPNKAWKQERYKKEWVIGDTVNASIGQGYVLSSPLQLAVMTSRIASGRAVSPRLIHSIDGVAQPAPAGPSLGLDANLLNSVRQGMFAVCNSQRGTGYSARIDDKSMRLAGKSGTSQVRNISAAERASGVISNNDLPWIRRDHALFVGFAPFDAPRYAAAVVVEHGGGGSTVAGPIVRDALLRAMSDGLPPLSAYPASQRNRIDTQQRGLILRDAEGNLPESTRA
jgi:penicillin-binding protein 2